MRLVENGRSTTTWIQKRAIGKLLGRLLAFCGKLCLAFAVRLREAVPRVAPGFGSVISVAVACCGMLCLALAVVASCGKLCLAVAACSDHERLPGPLKPGQVAC